MSMLDLRHYTVRFRESQRLRYRLPRLVWRSIIANRATRLELDRAKILLVRSRRVAAARPTARRGKKEPAARRD
jgi:hypothetical protein